MALHASLDGAPQALTIGAGADGARLAARLTAAGAAARLVIDSDERPSVRSLADAVATMTAGFRDLTLLSIQRTPVCRLTSVSPALEDICGWRGPLGNSRFPLRAGLGLTATTEGEVIWRVMNATGPGDARKEGEFLYGAAWGYGSSLLREGGSEAGRSSVLGVEGGENHGEQA